MGSRDGNIMIIKNIYNASYIDFIHLYKTS